MQFRLENYSFEISFKKDLFLRIGKFLIKKQLSFLVLGLSLLSIFVFYYYYQNGLGVAYNDARSHLDIARRVVDGLKTGLSQLGSVWLPIPHILMVPTVWNDFFWHSGAAGAIQSMASFVLVGILIFLYLKKLNVGLFGRLFAISIYTLNLNVLYLQATAMTELLLLGSMTASAYYFMVWAKEKKLVDLLASSFWVMVSTGIRYDGWFLFLFISFLLAVIIYRKSGYKETEGGLLLYITLGVFAIALWFLWNLLIFNDPLYFVFGPFSAHAQQEQIYQAGKLFTKGNLWLSTKAYLYAVFYNSYTVAALAGFCGYITFLSDKKVSKDIKISSVALLAPLFFNILALYLGHSVLFVVGVMGDTWFNVRYGIMLMPAIAIFLGYLSERLKNIRWVLVGLFLIIAFFALRSNDVVTIEDALIGASGKNVAEVSGWLRQNATNQKGFILISVASHDAIIFSSGLPMNRFIHEGTGKYWESAIVNPDKWARWIVMRTNDLNDMTFKELKDKPGLYNFELVDHYPFADIYQLKDEFLDSLNTKPVKWPE